MNQPLVSVIVTTYNNTATLDACLASLKQQSYAPLEIIVVDNNSKDDTKDIARRYTDKVFNIGPERCAQRNFGVRQSTGEYVMIIDSDMELGESVVQQCMTTFATDTAIAGVVIPEESFGVGFWAQCKRLERSYYVGIPWMEAARAFRKAVFLSVGGYDESMVSGEDWDLSQRVEQVGRLERITAYIRHNEGHLKLTTTLKKKYYYAQKFAAYTSKNRQTDKTASQTGLLKRYGLYLSRPDKLLENPLIGLGMLAMKTGEFLFGGIGYLVAQRKATE